MRETPSTAPETIVLTQYEVDEFRAAWRIAIQLREWQNNLVEQVSHITGESGDEDGDLSSTVAWDVVHNGDDLASVLRRCNLSLPTHESPDVEEF